MTGRIFRSIFIAAFIVFLASLCLITTVLNNHFSNIQKEQLRIETSLAAQGVTLSGHEYFNNLSVSGYRVTWIDTDGTVLYDSHSDASSMENHFMRDEVQQALKSGFGESVRYSSTILKRSYYSAQKLPDGTVMRLAAEYQSSLRILIESINPILLLAAVAVLLSLFLAANLSNRITEPLNDLDLDKPLDTNAYDELTPLLVRIDSQQKELKTRQAELRQKEEEFNTVIGSMNEGILLLSASDSIIAINPTAARILDVNAHSVGSNLLDIHPDKHLEDMLTITKNGHHCEEVITFSDKEYQFDANPIYSENKLSGIAFLIFDVTEKAHAEQIRREFTANVSHELKTPLHTISGCAELMANNIVKPEDIPSFSMQIYSEAQRLIRLVEDIIHLSKLDEGSAEIIRTKVDMFSLATETVSVLRHQADASDVKLSVSGEPSHVRGIEHILSGIIYNLCDNAIKYNRPGGTVNINTTTVDGRVYLSVRDTGIGIPPEHQDRIFERFYTVDKSRSNQVGGTGLGLSIVKHGAKIHDAVIDLQSIPGEGTTVTISFPVYVE